MTESPALPESNVFIPMRDGPRLAATLYLPETAGPWPALLEAYPYRKDDVSVWPEDSRRLRDEGDYAVCRVDTRGTGSSDGVAVDEYPPSEADDMCAVIAWLAEQPWCTGAVGMFGSSYAGFAALHAAMLGPPALRAIVPLYATDDRYTDDIHYGGGVRKAIELNYPLSMVALNALPPVPALAGDDWRERWIRRIEELVPWYRSIEEQNDGPFWRRGSLRPRYDLIRVPTMVIGGWSDLYRNAALRLIEHLDVPKRLLMGPWSHMNPIDSIPGPRIDHVRELIRWFDRWLRGAENGIDREPPVVLFVRRTTAPEPDLDAFAGEWRSEPEWPPARLRPLVLEPPDDGEAALSVRGDVGAMGHIRGTYYPPYGLALDQRPDEIHSLIFDWPVIDDLEILGNPVVELAFRSTHPVAFAAARLTEVLPDGTSVLVTRGILNLTHRDSHTHPEPLEPCAAYSVRIELDATSWVFTAGNRIRLAIAGAGWPDAWPPPAASELTVDLAGTRLVLPEVAGPPPVAEPPDLVHLAGARRDATEGTAWRIEHDIYGRETRVVVESASETDLADAGVRRRDEVRAGVVPHDPARAFAESSTDVEVAWPEVTARAVARVELRSDADRFGLDLRLDVYENGGLLRTRIWRSETPRGLC
jgi:predicted acyl esterase